MIREEAALRLARQILDNSIVRFAVNDAIIHMTARVIMTAVELDEQRQRTERLALPAGSTPGDQGGETRGA